tara:strand:+ start:1150 stop:1692 length:543 start_codon:yes stop_codon:yes gene_type:complete
MAMTVRQVTKSDGKIRFVSSDINYEYIPGERALWRINGDQFTLVNTLTEVEHQALLDATSHNSIGGNVELLGWDESKPVGDAFQKIEENFKIDVLPVQKQVLGKIPSRFEGGGVSGIGKVPSPQRVNFAKQDKVDTVKNLLDVQMPSTTRDLYDFILNAIEIREKTQSSIQFYSRLLGGR